MFTQDSPLFRDPSIIRRTLTFTHLVRMIHSISPPAKPYIGSKFDAPLRIHPNIMTVETEWSKNMCRPWSLMKTNRDPRTSSERIPELSSVSAKLDAADFI